MQADARDFTWLNADLLKAKERIPKVYVMFLINVKFFSNKSDMNYFEPTTWLVAVVARLQCRTCLLLKLYRLKVSIEFYYFSVCAVLIQATLIKYCVHSLNHQAFRYCRM